MSPWALAVVVLFPAAAGVLVVCAFWLINRALSHDFNSSRDPFLYGHPQDWWCPSCRKFHPRRMAHCPTKERR